MKFSPRSLSVLLAVTVVGGLSATTSFSYLHVQQTATEIGSGELAAELLDALDEQQLAAAMLPYDSEKRVDWHFIPLETRKGLKLREMSAEQQKQAHKLLQSCLSEAGYNKARKIMHLENLLYSLEAPGSRERRDPLKYYFTVFGDPRSEERWGLSVEGHHLSLNFVFDGDKMVASTPQVFAVNPAIIKTENQLGFEMGAQILPVEQDLAFELVNSLSAEQQGKAIFAKTALKEVRDPGSKHPSQDPAIGLPAGEMTEAQQQTFLKLITEYAEALPDQAARVRLDEIQEHGFDQVHFAWAGSKTPGIGHYYRIQGPSFVIEFVNTQPDAAGNPANHIHCLWRDMRGDFAISVKP